MEFKVGDEVWIPGRLEHGMIISCLDKFYLVAKFDCVLEVIGTFREDELVKYGFKEENKNMDNGQISNVCGWGTNSAVIKGVYPNREKGILIVKFDDNKIVRLHCDKDDNFDVNVGVALALAYKKFGSKNSFRKHVAKLTKEVKSKEKKEKNNKNTIYCGDMSWGEAIRCNRKARKISIQEVAKKAGVGASTISNAERGIYPHTTKRVKKAIEKALGIAVKE